MRVISFAVHTDPMAKLTKKQAFLRRDLPLILVLLLLSLSLLLSFSLVRKEGQQVTVTVDGTTMAVYPLSENGTYALNGGSNLLIIEDGAAYMKEADCPDRTCVRARRVRHTGERIVCLPNRLIVTVTGEDDVDLTV